MYSAMSRVCSGQVLYMARVRCTRGGACQEEEACEQSLAYTGPSRKAASLSPPAAESNCSSVEVELSF